MLPEKPSVTTTSTSPEPILSPSTKPRNCSGRRAGALQFFLADVEQGDLGAFQSQHGACKRRAHYRELHEVGGIAFGVGAQIEHHRFGFQCGQHRRQGRAINARHGAQREQGHRHQGASVAGRNGGIGLALLHGIDGHAH
jgi:hypothetical protein